MAATVPVPRKLTGVVVSAGKMMKTVKVRIAKQVWNKRIEKYYPAPYNLLVHDPTSSLGEGDIISLRPGYRASKHVHHVVDHIISPFGIPVESRPLIPTEAELLAAREAKRAEKDVRQAAKGRHAAARRVKERKAVEKRERHESFVREGQERKAMRKRLHTMGIGEAFLRQEVRGEKWRQSEEGRMWLRSENGLKWLVEREWFSTPEGVEWLGRKELVPKDKLREMLRSAAGGKEEIELSQTERSERHQKLIGAYDAAADVRMERLTTLLERLKVDGPQALSGSASAA